MRAICTLPSDDISTDELPLSELALAPHRVLGKDAMNSTLHYCSPAHGGWGVVRVACLIPETQLLFVCPEACGRHGAIAAVEQGYRHRITYLCVNDHEIVLGGYGAEIPKAVDDVMARVTPTPKAILLFLPCIDDLLGGDHEAVMREIEKKHGVPVRLTRMNPIMADNKMPPVLSAHKSLYEFLPKTPIKPKDKGVTLVGFYRPPSRDSELAQFFKRLGFGDIRHPEYCDTFESFLELGRSACALNLRPEGAAAAEFLATERGIPSVNALVSFDTPTILTRYQAIIDFLATLPGSDNTAPRLLAEDLFAETIKATEEKLRQTAKALQGKTVAVDSTVTASAFSLALALAQGGIRVNRIYTSLLPAHEKESFKKLAALDPTIIVANPNHYKKHGARPTTPLSDIAVGFQAAYATAAPVTLPLAFDEQRYGFEGFQKVLDALIEVSAKSEAPSDLREQIKSYGLVV